MFQRGVVPVPASSHRDDPVKPPEVQSIPFNFQIGAWRFMRPRRRLRVLNCPRPPFPKLDALIAHLDAVVDGLLLRELPAPLDPIWLHPRPGWIALKYREYLRHTADLTRGFEDYFDKFSSKTRSTLRRKQRKFAELSGGRIDWKEFRTPAELDQFFPLARRVSSTTYQERLLHAGLPDSESFRKEALTQAQQGRVRAYLLFLAGEPVSYLYLPVEGETAIYTFLGYDPAYAEHSPGTVLHLLAIESLCADPAIKMLDFTEGGGQHKELFSTHTEDCVDLLILRRWSKTAWIARAHRAFMRAESGLSRLAGRLGLKRVLKRLMRSG